VRRVVQLAVLALAAACPSTPAPGDQDLGTYGLHAEPAGRACGLSEVSQAPFDFQATLSRQSDGSAAWVTLAGYARDAGWDGQVMRSVASAERAFNACPCGLRVEEALDLALLSQSQASAVGLACPPGALDGGLPASGGDGGITPPAFTSLGFDAIIACGELRTRLLLVGDAGVCDAGCLSCTTRFVLTGARR
jgi:hypothetical protein